MTDPISTLSIIIVFATVFFDLVSKDVENFINVAETNIPQPDSVLNELDENYPLLIKKAIFLSLSFLVLTYLLLPQTVSILESSRFSVWNFDLGKTLFICIEIYLLTITFMSINLLYGLINTDTPSNI